MAHANPIPFHAKVRVHTADPKKSAINGHLGYVAGRTEQPAEDGRYGYGVFIYKLARVWCCSESELEVTGAFDEDAIRRSEQQRLRLAAKNAG